MVVGRFGVMMEILKAKLYHRGTEALKYVVWLILHVLTFKIPSLIITLHGKKLLPYWFYVLPDGVKILGPLSPEIFSMVWEIYHKRVYELMEPFVPKYGYTVVDCGANIGLYSLKMAKVAERVLAIEPEERNFRFLTMNIRLNKLTEKVIPVKVAVADRTDSAILLISESSDTHSLVQVGFALRYGYGVRMMRNVKTVSLDVLLRKLNIGKVDILKLDIEGAELLALRGLRNEVRRVKHVVLEAHTKLTKIEDLVQELSSMNFTVIKIIEIPGIPDAAIVYASRVLQR
jgi:FkbM family methyltransferase